MGRKEKIICRNVKGANGKAKEAVDEVVQQVLVLETKELLFLLTDTRFVVLLSWPAIKYKNNLIWTFSGVQ